MTGSKQKENTRERDKPSPGNYKLAYLEQKMGISRRRIMNAIMAIGSDRQKIEEYVKKAES